MSERRISHVIPQDGTEHTPVECYCHPDIHESNGTAALMGLEDAGVPDSPEGALTFVHHKAKDTAHYVIAEEGEEA